MINPEQRKEIIILLKILQNEEAWDKIHNYIIKVLSGREEDAFSLNVAREPVSVYSKTYSGMTEEDAQEILDAYNENADSLELTEAQWEEVEIADRESENPENLIPIEEFFSQFKRRWNIV